MTGPNSTIPSGLTESQFIKSMVLEDSEDEPNLGETEWVDLGAPSPMGSPCFAPSITSEKDKNSQLGSSGLPEGVEEVIEEEPIALIPAPDFPDSSPSTPPKSPETSQFQKLLDDTLKENVKLKADVASLLNDREALSYELEKTKRLLQASDEGLKEKIRELNKSRQSCQLTLEELLKTQDRLGQAECQMGSLAAPPRMQFTRPPAEQYTRPRAEQSPEVNGLSRLSLKGGWPKPNGQQSGSK